MFLFSQKREQKHVFRRIFRMPNVYCTIGGLTGISICPRPFSPILPQEPPHDQFFLALRGLCPQAGQLFGSLRLLYGRILPYTRCKGREMDTSAVCNVSELLTIKCEPLGRMRGGPPAGSVSSHQCRQLVRHSQILRFVFFWFCLRYSVGLIPSIRWKHWEK